MLFFFLSSYAFFSISHTQFAEEVINNVTIGRVREMQYVEPFFFFYPDRKGENNVKDFELEKKVHWTYVKAGNWLFFR